MTIEPTPYLMRLVAKRNALIDQYAQITCEFDPALDAIESELATVNSAIASVVGGLINIAALTA